jgi:hypothetical protein
MDYYTKYIKYKIKYINLKTNNNINLKTNNNINLKTNNNIKQKYIKIQNINNEIINNNTQIMTEVNVFGYTHSKICGGCIF